MKPSLLLPAAFLALTCSALGATDLSSLVNPLIGTDPNPLTKMGYAWDTGNVFPGAVCPRGVVAWSPDTTHKDNIAGGYWYPDDKIEGFSLTHFSGRGVPCLKDITFLPLAQAVASSPGTDWKLLAATFSHQNENASPGYYRVKLESGIEVELTATLRSGLARLTYPAQSTSALLIRANGAVAINGNEVSGRADWKPGRPKVYFFAQFSAPVKNARTWTGDKIDEAATAEGPSSGAILTFDTAANPAVQVRVGLSYTSPENARDNLAQENAGWDFTAVRQSAAEGWNKELSRVEVEGGTKEARTIFYTALYHCAMHPNLLDDANGEYRGMDDKVQRVPAGHHQYQNIPAWDQHRSHTPLLAILAPQICGDVMQSLVNYAAQDRSVRENGGGLPRWEQVNTNSGGMVGDGNDTMIAFSYAFGATGFDAPAALAAMDRGASQPGITSDGHKVRGGLEEYIRDGYVHDAASVTLEYCNDDFALGEFARALGDEAKHTAYLDRAQHWENLFDPAVGYLVPRGPAPKVEEATAAASPAASPAPKFAPGRGRGFVEGTAAQYLWMVNFNLAGLIEKLGGPAKTVERLDKFFTKLNGGLSSEYAYMGNETCEEAPWVYDFAGAPWRTQEVVRRIQTELFTAQPSGIPGNDDAGSLSSWYVFSALGLYPEIPGVAGFTVGSPAFPKAVIHLENGKTIQVIGKGASPSAPYVQSLQVNGKEHRSPWLPWSLIAGGGDVVFDLADKASQWGSDPQLAPPSFGSAAKR